MFVDTSGLMCLFDSRDHRHVAAVSHFDSSALRIAHNYVLAEFVALSIARSAPRKHALRFVDSISRGSDIELIWVGKELHDSAMQLLFERPDKSWSLCDAISFVIMNERQILNSLTTDHHFEQAGFVRLLDQ